ncbi:ATP-binding protein [Phenylobacterium sp.]|uniref:ATP-binding protein n=1 Tax=Phenylobacterium sp. TaxID=1871053 RepID=UPI002E3668CF|nr:ATP-binding protein [Phenylobacterium sp.]HEX4709112.1 ATP-binding protein [Phenylobacterium sp.]
MFGIRFHSIGAKLLAGLIASMTVLLLVDAVVTYTAYRRQDEQHRIADLTLYVQERARTEEELFDTLRAKQAAASDALRRRLAQMPPGPQVDRQFDAWFPEKGDGTRRSRDSLYDGEQTANGDSIYGVGAFLGHADALTSDDKRILTAATLVVSRVGESDIAKFENFFFLTPQDRLILFAPHRQERLTFFRKSAPAETDFDHSDQASYTLPQNDPAGRMRCTPLAPLLQDKTQRTLISGCVSPVYVDGRYVGAWGTTLMAGSYLTQVLRNTPAGATSLIASDKGELVAFPGFTKPDAMNPKAVAALQRTYGLAPLVAHIHATGKRTGVVESPDGKMLVAYGHLDGPSWLLLVAFPKAKAEAGVSAAILANVAGKFLIVAIGAAILFAMVRRLVISPLRALGDPRAVHSGVLARRPDEIGQLARTLRDERLRGDQALGDLEARVLTRTAELERANAAKTDFLANMSHELRTPLNGVIALSDMLAKEQTTDRGRQMAEMVRASGRLLEQVLTDILDISRIEAGQLSINSAPFDLPECVDNIAALHRASAEAKGLEFAIAIDDPARGWCVGDDIRVTQILSNLLSNAVKFTGEGTVSLSVARRGEEVTFTVTDTGVGFSPDFQARLFSRFEQADGSITRRFGGSGLGLAISGSLAEMMGGQIRATSEPGEGSAFTVTLPLAPAEPPVQAAPSDETAPSDISAMKVLVAEDHPTNRTVVSLILEPFGVDLTLVEDGRQAVEAVEREGFDLILMDLQMPVLDGLNATREIRALEAALGLARTPIVALSANALPEHIAEACAAGMDGHLAKPIRPDDLIALLSRALEEKEAQAAA